MSQHILYGDGSHRQVGDILARAGARKYMLVCGKSFFGLSMSGYFANLTIPSVVFQDFSPNPVYEDVVRGVARFRDEGCDAVVTVGGGSALDVAKCIKLFCTLGPGGNYLHGAFKENAVPLIAIPTTAGTGSESTRFSVIYFGGEKQSVAHDSILPGWALLEPGVLGSLPPYQKKCALLDALAQGIESWWSVNSTEESRALSRMAVKSIVRGWRGYLTGDSEVAGRIMLAANRSGQAINITQTTAAHAMSYKLTSLYGIAHGLAVALCLPKVWLHMLRHPEKCADPRGGAYLSGVFADIARSMDLPDPVAAARWLESLPAEMGLSPDLRGLPADVDLLVASVNLLRLKNNPVSLSPEDIRALYLALSAKTGGMRE